jgi:hypothetical protein
MSTQTYEKMIEETSPPTGFTQEIRARIQGYVYLIELDSDLAEFQLPPSMRPFAADKTLEVIMEITCTDGNLEIPAKARFEQETSSGTVYKLFDLSQHDQQKLFNHFDNLSEGIQVSRAMLAEDKAPPLEERDFQLLEKNRELMGKAELNSKQNFKQLVLSGLFLIIIGFFGWLLFISLYDIVAEDWGQQEYYTRISDVRLKVAEAQLREVDSNLDFTRSMLSKLQDPQFQQGVSPLQVEIFRRDEKVLQAHHDEMTELVGLLKTNCAEIAKGNFFYERRVLDSLSTEDRQAPTSSSAVLMMK